MDTRDSKENIVTYMVPATMQMSSSGRKFESLGIRELEPADEMMATQRAAGSGIRLAFELALQSLVFVNGKRVTLADGTADLAWKEMGPKLRNLVMSAYSQMAAASNEEVAAFLGSRKITV